jgi:endonuclease G
MKVSVKQLRLETNQARTDQNILDEKSAPDEIAAIAAREKDPLIKEITKGNLLGDDENLKKRREMIEAKGFEPTEFAYERAIGRNDSIYSNFVELLALTKRKVAKIVLIQNGKKLGYGTGFMVSKSLLLTNWHVFKEAALARESEAHFFYEFDAKGRPGTPVVFNFDTTRFYNNEELDYCFVAVQPKDVSGKVSLESIGYLFLDRGLGKIGEKDIERLNIIHHPQGDYKQISIRENLFKDVNETKIFYETDTAPGSSGSPVFNDQWQVVGLHHRSIAKMSADGKDYLDQDDNVIPVIDGSIDQSRIVWQMNEGMRISVVLAHLAEKNKGQSAVDEIAIAPAEENGRFTVGQSFSTQENQNNQNTTTMTNDNNNAGNDIKISIPVSALNAENSININVSSRKQNVVIGQKEGNGVAGKGSIPSEMLDEIAKADKESAVDFSKCKGYDPMFLGVNIAFPQPKKSVEKQIALLKDKSKELKYFKYSVIFNAVRRMPFISAINVEGDASKRKDDSKRSDDWLRDVRIDVAPQLFDNFYKASQFDKGHMSRFEDADWDNTEKDALRNGIYTCFYTNACPQVVALNRAGGLWGQLEKQVLEKGIKKEDGKQARMTVFNGPIFDDNKDRVFRNVMIPMQFFKVICWLDDNNKLKVTAFKLSQETLVDHIKFDELAQIEDLEALDIDQVTKFTKYQVSIKSLSKLAKIDFSHLEKFDTYKPNAHPDEIELTSADEIML